MSNPNQAFANMTMNVRQELCAVMVFAVVDKAGSIVMENEEEVSFDSGCFCAFLKLPASSSGCNLVPRVLSYPEPWERGCSGCFSTQTGRSWTVS